MKLLSAIFTILSITFCEAQKCSVDTFQFETVNNQKLDFDYYSIISKKKKPTIIFVHGGSFKNGSKNSTYIKPFAEKFVAAGYNVASIDYRLTLKGKSFHCDCPSTEKIKTFENAVYDIRAVTKHLLDNKKELKIDPKKIILAGNSAGAEAILHAAFWSNDQHNIDKQLLKNSFKYAGLIAYAGAIVDTILITDKNAIPTALFHGTCDQYVPYKTAPHHYCPDSTVGALMLSGSYDIMKRLDNLKSPYYLNTTCKAGHEINSQDISLKIDETIDFINKTVVDKKKIAKHTVKKTSKEKCNFVNIDFCD